MTLAAVPAERADRLRPIAIVDDHELLCQSLVTALERAGLPTRAVAPTDHDELLAQIRGVRPSVVLLDLELGPPLGTALDLVAPIRDLGTYVVIMTGVTDRVRLAECLEAGADGLLSKADPFDTLLAGIKDVTLNGSMLPLGEREALLHELRLHRAEEVARFEPFERLTVREAEVLHDLMQGANADRVAEMAFVSVSTVRSHIKAILWKLGVNSQLAAVATAQRAGWVGPDRNRD